MGALLGFPFMSGFYRKDMIIERFYSSYSSYVGGIFFLMGVGLTTAYRIKIMNLACINNGRFIPSALGGGGLRWQVKIPLSFLGLCSVLRGFLICLGLMGGFFLTNFKDKNFSSMLMLSPLF